MAIGDITQKWGSATEVAWSGSPALNALTSATLTAYSDELDITGLQPVVDILVQLKMRTVAGSLGTNPVVVIYAGGSIDGTNFPPLDADVLTFVGAHVPQAADTSEWSAPFSLAAAFGGVLPASVQFAVRNDSGLNLNATADTSELWYTKVFHNQTVS